MCATAACRRKDRRTSTREIVWAALCAASPISSSYSCTCLWSKSIRCATDLAVWSAIGIPFQQSALDIIAFEEDEMSCSNALNGRPLSLTLTALMPPSPTFRSDVPASSIRNYDSKGNCTINQCGTMRSRKTMSQVSVAKCGFAVASADTFIETLLRRMGCICPRRLQKPLIKPCPSRLNHSND